MRPIKLTISAFGPYANEQVIDFNELNGKNMFVITGKTGCGKTTIFDAISFALFGEASGDVRESDGFRSHFSDEKTETFVELEFELKGQVYKLKRNPSYFKKKRNSEEMTKTKPKGELYIEGQEAITKVTEINEKIKELLGIDKNQFKQIVMLAQGEFKKLLLSSSDDKEKIFRKIFGTYTFEKIQEKLKEKAKNLNDETKDNKLKIKSKIEMIKDEEIIVDEYIDFVCIVNKITSIINKNEENYNFLQNEINELDKNIEENNANFIKFENINKQLEKKEKIVKEYENLINLKEEYKIKDNDLLNIKKSEKVKILEDNYLESNKRQITKQNELSKSLELIKKLKIELQKSNEEFEKEIQNDEFRKNLEIELENLKSIEPKIDLLENLKKELNINKINLEKIEKEKVNNQQNIKNCKENIVKIDKEFEEINESEKELIIIEKNISENMTKIKKLGEIRDEIKSYEERLIEYQEETSNYEKLNANYKNKKDIYQIKEKNYEEEDESYKNEQAGILASNLIDNIACPVCGSTIHPSPAKLSSQGIVTIEQLKILSEELKVLKNDLDKVKNEKEQKYNKVLVLKKSLDEKLKNLNKLLKENDINDYSQISLNEIEKNGKSLKTIIISFKSKQKNLEEKISSKETKKLQKQNLEKDIISFEENLTKNIEKEKNYSAEIAKITSSIEENKKQIPKNIETKQILEIEIKTKNKTLIESKEKLEKIRILKEENNKKLSSEEGFNKEINNSLQKLIEETKINKELFEKETFESYEIYKDRINEISKIEKEIKEYENNLEVKKQLKETLEKETEGLQKVELEDLKNLIKDLKNKRLELVKNQSDVKSNLDNNKNILEEIKKLQTKCEKIENEYKIIGDISDVANGKNNLKISFERYILASYFDEILNVSNLRLSKMTNGRYEFIRKTEKGKGSGQKGLEINIFDSYTNSLRDVKSLSGGESFKASLSLALGLSDIVQSNAGGISIETMFIDEGFGSLDPESLDNAIDTLVELQEGGRLVGIISHIEELKERIDAKLEITSTNKGSKAKFNVL